MIFEEAVKNFFEFPVRLLELLIDLFMEITKVHIPSKDPRLNRHINHDPRSRNFAFDTSGLIVSDIVHKRHIGILNQEQTGSCTGNAGIGNLATDPLFATIPVVSPHYSLDEYGAQQLYSDAEVIDGNGPFPPNDNGSSGLSIAKALKNSGVISGYQHVFTFQDALKVASIYPFITGTYWYRDMFTPDADGRAHITGDLMGGHEYEVAEIDVANQKIWFFNSWGEDWGLGGKFYLTFSDYQTLLSQQGDVTILLPNTKPMKPQHTFALNLNTGISSPEVTALQQALNYDKDTQVATVGPGSPGNETMMFGALTKAAVKKFQAKYGVPQTGNVGPLTRAQLNKLYGVGYTLAEAIIQVESEGDTNVIGDNNITNHAYGCMQIRQGVCDDVNKNFGLNFKPFNMLGNAFLSICYFEKYCQIYLPNGTDEQKSRLWNAGPNWQNEINATNDYWSKVKGYLSLNK